MNSTRWGRGLLFGGGLAFNRDVTRYLGEPSDDALGALAPKVLSFRKEFALAKVPDNTRPMNKSGLSRELSRLATASSTATRLHRNTGTKLNHEFHRMGS